MNLALVKVIGLVSEGIHTHLNSLCNENNEVTIDFTCLSDLFKVRVSVIESSVSSMAFLGLLFKLEKGKYRIENQINQNNLKCGHIDNGVFIPYSFDREAVLLYGIIDRCCTESGYSDVTWSKKFSDVEFFREWCLRQVGYKERDSNNNVWHIDKDLLSPYKSREYSEENCLFLPQSVNNLLIRRKGNKTLPTGVTFVKNTTTPYTTTQETKYLVNAGRERNELPKSYAASITLNSVRLCLGRFITMEEASVAYNYAKKVHITDIAEKWKGNIDQRAYQALLNFDLNRLKRDSVI